MAKSATALQDELDDVLEDVGQAKGILEDAYTPEATREELAQAIGAALDALEDYESSDDDEDDLDDDDDDPE